MLPVLPDFLELKSELSRLIVAKLRGKIHSRDRLVSSLRRSTQHEGRLQRYEQLPDGNLVEEGFELMSAEVSTPVSDVPTLIGPALEKKLDELADRAVSQMTRSLFKKIEETTDKAGTTVNAHGRPMSPDLLLEMIEKVQMEFDAAGNPTTTIVIHPDMAPSFKAAAEQIENDPKLKRRSDDILRRQREAWAARESNRKLVD